MTFARELVFNLALYCYVVVVTLVVGCRSVAWHKVGRLPGDYKVLQFELRNII